MRALILYKMGNDNNESDLTNYRLRFENLRIKDEFLEDLRKGAEPYISGDFISGFDIKTKKFDKLYLDSEYKTKNGEIWAPRKLEHMIFNGNYKYNKKDLLKIINKIAKKHYQDIIIKEMGC